MNANARQRVATAQAELVRALVGQGPVPAGFDAERVQGSSRSRYSEPYLRRTFGLIKLEGRPHRLLWAKA